MTASAITCSHEGDVFVITIDDGKVNALSLVLLQDFDAALDQALDKGGGAKAVVIAGREGQFSAGFDLRVMMSGAEAASRLVMAGANVMLKLYDFPLPVVMACTGNAIAGGALLLATPDVRIGASGAFKIGLNEITNGIILPILAHRFVTDRLQPNAVVESVLHARLYDPESAAKAGWLDRVADGDVKQAALEHATRLAKLPNFAYAATKRSLRRDSIETVRATLEANIAELTGALPG